MNPRKTHVSVSYAGITRIRFMGLGVRFRRLSRDNPAPPVCVYDLSPFARFCQAPKDRALSMMNWRSQSPASLFFSAKSMMASR